MVEMVGETEEETREGRSRRVRKEVMGYAQAVVRGKKFLVQFKYCKNREMGYFFLRVYVLRGGVVHEVNGPISDLLKKKVGC